MTPRPASRSPARSTCSSGSRSSCSARASGRRRLHGVARKLRQREPVDVRRPDRAGRGAARRGPGDRAARVRIPAGAAGDRRDRAGRRNLADSPAGDDRASGQRRDAVDLVDRGRDDRVRGPVAADDRARGLPNCATSFRRTPSRRPCRRGSDPWEPCRSRRRTSLPSSDGRRRGASRSGPAPSRWPRRRRERSARTRRPRRTASHAFDHPQPNPDVDTSVASSIRRAKSYVTCLSRIAASIEATMRSAASRPAEVAQHHLGREDEASPGFTLSWPAYFGAVPCVASKNAGPCRRSSSRPARCRCRRPALRVRPRCRRR